MKPWVIIAIILTALGIVLFLVGLYASNFDFSKLSTANAVTNSYRITDEFESISIDTDVSDVIFLLSNDESCEVFCQETDKNLHTVRVENGVLTIKQEDQRKWYDHIGINWAEVKVSVLLPRAEFDRLQIDTDTGKVEIGNQFTFNSANVATTTGYMSLKCNVTGSLNVATSTGAITIQDITAKALNAACSTGKIALSNVTAAEGLNISTTTGAVVLENCTAAQLQAECDTGKITLTNTVVSGQLKAETSTGNIKLNGCDADSLILESDTGDITGTLLSEKIIFAQSDTGKISVPRCNSGGRCEITTDTGNIRIEIAPVSKADS